MFNRRLASTLIASMLLTPTPIADAAQGAPLVPSNVATAQQKISALAVPFVPNLGQWDQRAAFKANTLGGALFVTTEGALVYSFPGKPLVAESPSDANQRSARRAAAERGPGWTLTETLIDRKGQARALKPAGLGPNESKVSYFTSDNTAGNDRPINTYNRVQLGEVYPGVNLQLRATGNNMEKIFTVAPGHNPNQIQLKLEGADQLEVNDKGHLVAHTGNGPISFTAPIAFQQDAQGKRDAVTVAYALEADHARYGFTLGRYDTTRALIIDPLLQTTYLGDTSSYSGQAMTVHPVSGEVLIAGFTGSSNLPGRLGGAQPARSGGFDAFVSRFNANLTSLLQSTYFGGSGDDIAYAMTVHPVSGEVLIGGYTTSTNLPGTIGGAQITFGGGGNTISGATDAFVSRFNANLTSLLQSTYLGGSDNDYVYAISVHPVSGEVLVAGNTASGNLPGTSGGAQAANGGGFDAFVSRFNASLSALLQSTYVGGSADDYAYALTVHPVSGEVLIAGSTDSSDLPGTTGGAQSANGGDTIFFVSRTDAFVSRLNASLTTLLQSTYLGGSANDVARAISVHPASGEILVAGFTSSSNLPGAAGGAQSAFAGGVATTTSDANDAFVSRFNASLSTLLQSTYLGGSSNDRANSITVHPASGEILVAGATGSSNFPGAAGGARSVKSGVDDAFVSRFNASLTTRLQSTYLGGTQGDSATALVVLPVSGDVLIAGFTSSNNLPGTAGGAQSTFGGAFISRLTPDLAAFCVLDINGDGAVTPDKDGSMLLRYLLGFRGAALIADIPLGPGRVNAMAVETFIGTSAQYQAFGQSSGPAKAMQDGLVLFRLMQGIGDSALLNGTAPPTGATFTTATTVRANVNARCGMAY